MRDVYNDALNSPPGRLAEILLIHLTKGRARKLSNDMRARLERLVDAPGMAGRFARVRLAAAVPILFDRAPNWTKSKIIPLFHWSSADAADVWSSRKYSNIIGPPELFRLTKEPFLEMFGRSGVPRDDLQTFAEWLTAIFIANQGHDALYPLAATEARAALRRAGAVVLPSVGHRLALEMEGARPDEKEARWQTVVGPVFQAIWPIDIELQSPASTLKLAQILRATGEAFPKAADMIIPLMRPDDQRGGSAVFAMAEAPDQVYASSPAKMLDVLASIVGEPPPGSVYRLGKALARISKLDPKLAGARKFQRLMGYASRIGE
jgi:hypothetical protein